MNTQVRDFRPFPLGINFNIEVVLHAGKAIVATGLGCVESADWLARPGCAGPSSPSSSPLRLAPPLRRAGRWAQDVSSAEIHSRPGLGRTWRVSCRVLCCFTSSLSSDSSHPWESSSLCQVTCALLPEGKGHKLCSATHHKQTLARIVVSVWRDSVSEYYLGSDHIRGRERGPGMTSLLFPPPQDNLGKSSLASHSSSIQHLAFPDHVSYPTTFFFCKIYQQQTI